MIDIREHGGSLSGNKGLKKGQYLWAGQISRVEFAEKLYVGGMTGSGYPNIHSVAEDEAGNMYISIAHTSLLVLRKYSAKGTLVWEKPAPTGTGYTFLNYVGGFLYGMERNNLYKIDPADGSTKWTVTPDGTYYITKGQVHNDSLYLWCDQTYYLKRINLVNGATIEQWYIPYNNNSYCVDKNGDVHVTTNDKYLRKYSGTTKLALLSNDMGDCYGVGYDPAANCLYFSDGWSRIWQRNISDHNTIGGFTQYSAPIDRFVTDALGNVYGLDTRSTERKVLKIGYGSSLGNPALIRMTQDMTTPTVGTYGAIPRRFTNAFGLYTERVQILN